MSVSNLPPILIRLLHDFGIRKMSPTELILFDGNHARHFYDPLPSQILYHYTSAAAAASIIQSNQIWLSEFSQTNDAAEFTYARDRYLEAIPKYAPNYKRVVVQEYLNRLNAFEKRGSMLIGSFTENRDDVAQWERYADNARGCVLGYDAHWFWKYPGLRLLRVVYDKQYLDNLVEANLYTLNAIDKKFSKAEPLSVSLSANSVVLEQFCIKDSRFASEQEVRITRAIRRDPNDPNKLIDHGLNIFGMKFSGPFADPFEVKCRAGAYGPTSYIELPTVYNGTSALKSVGFGPRTTFEDEQTIRAACENLPSVELWRSDLPLR